jgi:hypothetical protein
MRTVRVTRASAFLGGWYVPDRPPASLGSNDARGGAGSLWRERAQRRDPRHSETSAAAVTRIRSQPLEVIGGIPEGHATVAFRVFVPALEALTGVAEQERARGHHHVAKRRSILEGARQHDRHRILRVLFLERAILRP